MDQLFALGHVYSGAQILAVVDDLARQFALRLQLSANTHDMPEVRPVRPKKRSALIKPSLLLEATSHTAMGIRRRKHETHDNSISLRVRALQYVRACKIGS